MFFFFICKERTNEIGCKEYYSNEPVVIEDLGEDTRMSIEKVLVEDGIVVSQSFCEPRQSRGGNLFQCGLVRFVPDAAAVEYHPIIGVAHVHHCSRTG